MGQKVRPTGFRTGIMSTGGASWYASKQDFADLLVEDFKIRKFIKKKLQGEAAAIAKIRIERTREKVIVFDPRRPASA